MWCSTVSGVSHFSHRPVGWQLILDKTWLRVQWPNRSLVSNVSFDLLFRSVYLIWLLTVGWISKYLLPVIPSFHLSCHISIVVLSISFLLSLRSTSSATSSSSFCRSPSCYPFVPPLLPHLHRRSVDLLPVIPSFHLSCHISIVVLSISFLLSLRSTSPATSPSSFCRSPSCYPFVPPLLPHLHRRSVDLLSVIPSFHLSCHISIVVLSISFLLSLRSTSPATSPSSFCRSPSCYPFVPPLLPHLHRRSIDLLPVIPSFHLFCHISIVVLSISFLLSLRSKSSTTSPSSFCRSPSCYPFVPPLLPHLHRRSVDLVPVIPSFHLFCHISIVVLSISFLLSLRSTSPATSPSSFYRSPSCYPFVPLFCHISIVVLSISFLLSLRSTSSATSPSSFCRSPSCYPFVPNLLPHLHRRSVDLLPVIPSFQIFYHISIVVLSISFLLSLRSTSSAASPSSFCRSPSCYPFVPPLLPHLHRRSVDLLPVIPSFHLSCHISIVVLSISFLLSLCSTSSATSPSSFCRSPSCYPFVPPLLPHLHRRSIDLLPVIPSFHLSCHISIVVLSISFLLSLRSTSSATSPSSFCRSPSCYPFVPPLLPHLHRRSAINSWYLTNGLLVNPGKSDALLIGSSAQRRKIDDSGVFMSGTEIKFSDSLRLLGVTLDSGLSLDQTCHKYLSTMQL